MKKIFYWRFSRKIEGEFWIFYKRFLFIFFGREAAPALVLHVLAKAFTREKPSAPRRRPPPPEGPKPKVLVVSEVKWVKWVKWVSEWKWSVFGPLNSFIFGYVKGGVLGNNNIGIKKCTTTFLWVLNLGQVGEILENFQNHPLGERFWKIFSKVIFWKNCKGISL